MSMNDKVKWELVSGSPTTVGEVTVTPQSQALSVRWPNGGWVWNRPVAVQVERDGQSERLPILDVTRAAQLTLYGISLFLALLTILLTIKQKKRR